MGLRKRLLRCFGCGGEEAPEEQQQEEAGKRPGGGGKPKLRRLSTANLRSLSLQDLSRKLETTRLHAFTLDELKAATKNFSTTNFLGEGGFGPVYKGFVDGRLRPGLEPQHVAVKYLDLESDGVQGHREWLVRRDQSTTEPVLACRFFHRVLMNLASEFASKKKKKSCL
jgi:hypothetical protein